MRYDLSWQALDATLARRAVVARAVAVDAYGGGPDGKRLAALADAAERAPRTAREAAENELSAALALVDPASLPLALVAELADAEARVLLARRFHNDAVRDTLALRERPAVRVAASRRNRRAANLFRDRRTCGGVATGGRAAVSRRTSARVVLLDEDGCGAAVLRVRPGERRRPTRRGGGSPSAGPPEQGETLAEAAARETGGGDRSAGRSRPTLVGPVWRRDAVIDFNGSVIRSEEMFFVHRTTPLRAVDRRAHRAGAPYIHGHRWCDATMIEELVAKGETVYPLQLGELLDEANALADARGGAPERQLQSIR